jgi:hypothetical protein
MIPLGDVVPRRTRPVLTHVVTGLLAGAVLGFHLLTEPGQRHAWLWTWGATAASLPWPALATAWWLEPAWLAGVANAAVLLLLGPAVEDRLGHDRVAALLAVTIAGTAMATAWAPALTPRPVAGAAPLAAAVAAAHVRCFSESRLAWWLPGPAGGRVWETSTVILIGVWAIVVPGHLAQAVQPGPVPTPPLLGTAIGAGTGLLLARRLARPERCRVDWWDGETRSRSDAQRPLGS